MSEEQRNAGDAGIGTGAASVPAEQPFPDEHTTVPNPHEASGKHEAAGADGKWQMPKPKFQQTSGYLPQGYLNKLKGETGPAAADDDEPETAQLKSPQAPPPDAAGSAAAASPAAMPLVEPQPDLADQLIPDQHVPEMSAPPMAAKPKPTALMFVLGLIGIILAVAIFIAVVAYFTWASRQSGPF